MAQKRDASIAVVTPTRVVVIGGGVIGVTTAAALASRGLKVTLIERSHALGVGATARNGAQLSYGYADALASQAVLRHLPQLLAGLDPAFRIRASLDPAFLSWVLRFLANCTRRRFAANTAAVLRLALESRSALAALKARHPGLEFQHGAPGKLHIYDAAENFAAAASILQLKHDLGCEQRAVSIDEARALEPALSACRRTIVGAIYSPLDEVGDPYLFTQSLAAVVQREHGVALLTSTAVERLIVDKHRVRAVSTSRGLVEGDVFLLAAGCASRPLADAVGVRVPIHPMKGYSITLPATAASPVVSITDNGAKIVFCRLQDRVRIAGLAEIGRTDDSVDPSRIATLVDAARACLPAAADWRADLKPWCGLRPMTPDCRPIIGRTPIANLFLNCGHGALGWTLACGSAELCASVALDDYGTPQTRALANDLSLARFLS